MDASGMDAREYVGTFVTCVGLGIGAVGFVYLESARYDDGLASKDRGRRRRAGWCLLAIAAALVVWGTNL